MSISSPVPRSNARRQRLPWAVLGLVGGLLIFAAGMYRLLDLRFDVGDIYPPYSTLRSDPLGAKVFFESLREIPGVSAERNLRPLASIGVPAMSPPGADHGEARFTCFVVGADTSEWPYLFERRATERLESILARGGRVVITFRSITRQLTAESLDYAREKHEAPDKPADTPKKKREKERHERHEQRARAKARAAEPDLAARWGIDFRRSGPSGSITNAIVSVFKQGVPAASPSPPPSPTPVNRDHDTDAQAAELARTGKAAPVQQAAPAAGDPPVPSEADTVPWRTAADFKLDDKAATAAKWQAWYRRADRPVIVARPYGTAGGEIVLVSDTYFLSNEGLRADAHPALLAALVGRGQRVLFDESHLGVAEHPGLMTLARRYRLQGALAALGLVVALFVWRSAVSLVPPRPAASTADDPFAATPTGREAAAGFLNLLHRGVLPRELLSHCLTRWEQNLAPGSALPADVRYTATAANTAKVRRATEEASAKGSSNRSPAAVYRAACAALRAGRVEGRR